MQVVHDEVARVVEITLPHDEAVLLYISAVMGARLIGDKPGLHYVNALQLKELASELHQVLFPEKKDGGEPK